MKKDLQIYRLLSIQSVVISVVVLVLVFIFILRTENKLNKYDDIRSYAKSQVDKEWFDYSYDIIENVDENGEIRYRITYYWSKVNEQGTLDLIVFYKDGKLNSEEI